MKSTYFSHNNIIYNKFVGGPLSATTANVVLEKLVPTYSLALINQKICGQLFSSVINLNKQYSTTLHLNLLLPCPKTSFLYPIPRQDRPPLGIGHLSEK